MKRSKLFLLLVLVALFETANAQKDIAKFFPAAAVPTGGSSNVQQLVTGYMQPVTDDFAAGINNGWYTTASTHKKFGFDIGVTMNVVNIGSDVKSFSVPNTTGLEYNGTNKGGTKAPSADGSTSEFPSFTYMAGANIGKTFNGPGGAGFNDSYPMGAIAVPTIQAGLGLFANTDLRVRYTPTVTINGLGLSSQGIAVMHDIKQHIKGIRQLPFSLSVLVGYSQLKETTDLSGIYSGSGQAGAGKTNAYTIQALVGKSIAILTVYAGLGFNGASTSYKINGTYNVDHTDTGTLTTPVTLTNPFDKKFTSSGVRATGGLRLNLGPLKLNGDYTFYGSRKILTVGVGISVR